MEKNTSYTTSHSHIQGIGINENGLITESPNGIIGQESAREAASLIVDMVKQKRISGRGILLYGPSCSGKTALAISISKELGQRIPFIHLSASEMYSCEINKSQNINQHARMAIKLRMKEVKDVYEGELVEYKVNEESNRFIRNKKDIKEIVLTLKSTKGMKNIKLSPSLFNIMLREKISVGDIIYVEANSGIIKRLGRSESYMNDTDLESEHYVPLSKGEVMRKREVVQEVTLNDLDIAHSRPIQNNIVSAIKEITHQKKSEIGDRLREDVNKVVFDYIEKGNCEIIPGVLFIDEAYMLDNESISFLTKIMESKLSPSVILSTNRLNLNNEDKNEIMMPKDFLERLLIVRMEENTIETVRKIILARMKEEGIELDDDTINYLCDNYGLRYIMGILPLLKSYKDNITLEDVIEVTSLFHFEKK